MPLQEPSGWRAIGEKDMVGRLAQREDCRTKISRYWISCGLELNRNLGSSNAKTYAADTYFQERDWLCLAFVNIDISLPGDQDLTSI